MTGAPDHYEVYYADKLWNLLPAVYRAEDTDQYDAKGPLREIVDRIGAQAAILRRSIDRLWEDQSIETCDDWVIPYIGDLLSTNLVPGLDARGQRLDVAKTIYYRRRKGTLAVLDEIAANITGWDAKLVEFFRRMGRTRHGLDPPIGATLYAGGHVAQLQRAEGLAGALTHTGIGGFADLRNVYGASKAHSAFDEFFYTADMRLGRGRSGWYNIPRLGVFLWRLKSYGVGPVTPVPVDGCPDWYSFDPTGRDIPLFAVGRSSAAFGNVWVSPVEAQLPTPISQLLLDANLAGSSDSAGISLYPDALAVAASPHPPDINVLPANQLRLRPELGRFEHLLSPPARETDLVGTYHYGFSSDIGAGPYDRRGAALPIAGPMPASSLSGGVGGLLATGAVPSSGTVTIADSLTYAGAPDIHITSSLTLRAGNRQRPLVRLAPVVPWRIRGASSSSLSLDGLFVSGGDIVLTGDFESVILSCCTLDPGSAAALGTVSLDSPPTGSFATAADGRALVPTRLWVEGTIKNLTIDRCILGPVHTRNGGSVETTTISNSIVQAIPTGHDGVLTPADVKDPRRFEQRLQLAEDPVSVELLNLAPQIAGLVGGAGSPPGTASPPSTSQLPEIVSLIHAIVAGPSIYDPGIFAAVPLSAATQLLLQRSPALGANPVLNRRLLDDAFPLELADAALAFADGALVLDRCTIMGRIIAHRLEASECILQDLAEIDDTQNGCVRFTAWADGSVLPRKYESVRIAQQAALFASTAFGQPAYGRLLPLVEAAILGETNPTGGPQNTISAGAEDGSEMGAFARDKNPVKERALLIKYQEFMPAGLVPVLVYVT
jgi:hypothetical protein